MNRRVLFFMFFVFLPVIIFSQEENSKFLKIKLVDYVKLYKIDINKYKLAQISVSIDGGQILGNVQKECREKFKSKLPVGTMVVVEFEEKIQTVQTKDVLFDNTHTFFIVTNTGIAIMRKH